MKIRANRKLLVTNLKLLKTLSSRSKGVKDQDKYSNTLMLSASNSKLGISAGFGYSFVTIYLPVEVEEEGDCILSYRLLDVLKAVHDDEVTLKHNKNLILTSDSGLRATINEMVVPALPIKNVEDLIEKGVSKTLELQNEQLENLAELSDAFDSIGIWKKIEIVSNEQGINGSVQGSEEGLLECLPMQGQGDPMFLRLRPDYLKPVLSFCGERVRLQMLTAYSGFVLVSDPDNADWWGVVSQIGNSQQEAYKEQ